ncbi:MAG: restriction endonuclease subunit S [Rheinheimera sp.]|nr:restriction endonuclease subunit S [Rheinheimera sp.]
MSKAQTFSLGEVCSFYNGKAHENAISESGNIKVINSKFVSSEGASYKLTNEVIFPLYKGDICLVMSDVPNGKTLAKCFLVDRDNSYSLNQRICVIRTNNFDLKFLFYQLNRHPYLLAFNNGENQTNLRKENILNCPLWMPSIPEQKRIVAILDQAFADIDQVRATAETNLKNTRELLDSYLQKVFSQRGEGWNIVELEKVSNIVNGYAFSSSDFSSQHQVKSIKITNVGVYEFIEDSDNFLPMEFSKEYSRYRANEGDIVIALTRTIISSGLKVATVPASYDGALVNQRVAVIQANEKVIPKEILQAFLSTRIATDYVKSNVNELMQPNLSIKDLRAFPIPIPPSDIVESISKDIYLIRERTNQLLSLYTRKIKALDELKKSILQKAFAGELTKSEGIAA